MKRWEIEITTDGACSGNPGPGGWGAILELKDKNYSKEFSGYLENSTNVRAELEALIGALEQIHLPGAITVRTDCMAVCNTIATLDAAHDSGWKTKAGGNRANKDLLQKLYDLVKGSKLKDGETHKLFYKHVPGHSGDERNERCDKLAKQQIKIHAA